MKLDKGDMFERLEDEIVLVTARQLRDLIPDGYEAVERVRDKSERKPG